MWYGTYTIGLHAQKVPVGALGLKGRLSTTSFNNIASTLSTARCATQYCFIFLNVYGGVWVCVYRGSGGGVCHRAGGGRKRLPKFKFSAKFPIGLHVILQILIKKFENDCYIMRKIILTENPSRCNLAPLLK